MQIVVLDGHALNPGDLSWQELEGLCASCAIYPRTPATEILERARDAGIVLTNKTPLSAETIDSLPKLKYIGVLATGYNVVDTDAAAARSIPVTNIPSYGTDSVAQTALMHILNLATRFSHHTMRVQQGAWSSSKDWTFWDFSPVELRHKTVGIIGFGRIGRRVAKMAHALGMKVIFYSKGWQETEAWAGAVELDELFQQSDVISLHCPLTEETRGLINKQRLDIMKPTACLVNTARGELVDEEVLANALNSGRIAGAGLDVLSQEPPPTGHVLLKAKNCYITPHQAWATKEARQRLLNKAVENVRGFLDGKLQNCVNGVSLI